MIRIGQMALWALGTCLALPGLALAESGGGGLLEARFDLTIWTIVIFVLLLLVLRYVTLPGAPKPAWVMMIEGLQRREEAIRGALEEAQRTREEAQQLREQLQQEMNQANEKVRQLMEEARQDAARLKEEITDQGHREVQANRERFRREVEVAKGAALQEIWNQAAQLATLISSKAIRKELTPDLHRQLVDEALRELGQTQTNGSASA
jgi:F-type H+-transporting ATPase subunit b